MKNIIEIIKDIALNKRGAATQNVLKGLSVGVFASVIGYGVYTSYNNSPAYNPERRALFIAENQNLNVNSLDSGGTGLDVSDGIPVGMQNLYGEFGKAPSGDTMQDRINQNEADFENARAYLHGQRGGETGGPSGSAPAENGPSIPAAQRGQVTQWGQSGQPLRPEALQTSQPAPVRDMEKEISPTLTNAVRNQAGQNPNPNLTVKGGTRGSFDKGGTTPPTGTSGSGGTDGTVGAAGSSGDGGQTVAGKNPKGGQTVTGKKPGIRNAKQPTGTTINKLAGSNGSSPVGGAAGGSSGGGFSVGTVSSPSGSRGGQDGGAQPLPLNTVSGKNGGTFRTGRGGNMGGFNVARGGGSGEGTRGDDGGKGASDLKRAYNLSKGAGKSLQRSGSKGTAAHQAAAAFDGSEGGSGAGIDGENVNTSTPRDLASSNYGDVDVDSTNNKLTKDPIAQYDLEGCAQTHILRAALAALAAMYVLVVLKKMADAGGPYAWVAWVGIVAVMLSALYSIWCIDYDGNGKYIWEDMSDLWKLNSEHGDSQFGSWAFWMWPALGLLTVGVIASIFDSKLINLVSKFQQNVIGKGFGTWAIGKVVSDGRTNINNIKTKLK